MVGRQQWALKCDSFMCITGLLSDSSKIHTYDRPLLGNTLLTKGTAVRQLTPMKHLLCVKESAKSFECPVSRNENPSTVGILQSSGYLACITEYRFLL